MKSTAKAFVAIRSLFLIALIGAGLCCHKDNRATNCSADRESLQSVLAEDQRVAGLLREVDDMALRGKPLEAAIRIENDALPAMQKVVDRAEKVVVRTKWGEAQQRELLGLTQRRQELIKAYAKALRTEDLQKVLAELERQRDLEKLALEVQRKATRLPPGHAESCDQR
ncbi:MAG: hypothetical protein CSA75_01290 [Sorangium cellulosum]|nr:MAG: hypothetical protein CSA75_01290 [Sorangium cellulosum]